jgi:anti-sigma factor RsiW
MECNEVQIRLFRKIDGELSESEHKDVNAHLAECAVCAREYGLLALPRRIASHIPPIIASPFFYQKLKARIDSEAQGLAGWQMLWALARQMIPAMAGITLALLSILAYLQLNSPAADMYRDYENVFIAEDQPRLIFTADRGDITDVSVLSAIAEREPKHQQSNAK